MNLTGEWLANLLIEHPWLLLLIIIIVIIGYILNKIYLHNNEKK